MAITQLADHGAASVLTAAGSGSRTDANNFDALRLLLALLVFWAHRALIWPMREAPLGGMPTGLFAVFCFFVISGYLIFQSFERTPNLRRYLEKRARRIYPAYFVVVMACAIGGALLTTATAGEYFGLAWARYLLANLSFMNFIQPTLPGVFSGQAEGGTVNGALWSIKIEVAFYLSVPVICYLARRTGRMALFAAIYAASVLWMLYFAELSVRTGNERYFDLAKNLPGAMAFFIAGASVFYYWTAYVRHARILVPLCAIGVVLHYVMPSFAAVDVLLPFNLAVVVLYVALLLPMRINGGRFGDLSYGFYIIHTPVLQTVRSLRVFPDNHWAAYGVGFVCSLILAFASWHLVEKPFLSSTSHYVRANRSEAVVS